MVGPLDLLLLGDTRLLEQVGDDVASTELAAGGEVDTDEFTESRGVVVPRSLGIAIGLQDWVGGNDLVLKGHLLQIEETFSAKILVFFSFTLVSFLAPGEAATMAK